jgi:hypothetical protein
VISEKIGMILKKNTKTKIWWMKLGISIVISNIFFFLLFAGDPKSPVTVSSLPEGWVEAHLNAELMTPFDSGKKVTLINRKHRLKIDGVLQSPPDLQAGKMTILVKENEASALFQYNDWEVLPFLKDMNFTAHKRSEDHEILY